MYTHAEKRPDRYTSTPQLATQRSILIGMDGTPVCHINKTTNKFAVRNNKKILAVPITSYERGNTPEALHNAIELMENKVRQATEETDFKEKNKFYTERTVRSEETDGTSQFSSVRHSRRVTPEHGNNRRPRYVNKPDNILISESERLGLELGSIQGGLKMSKFNTGDRSQSIGDSGTTDRESQIDHQDAENIMDKIKFM